MIRVQYGHSAGSSIYRRLEYKGGAPDPVLDKKMSQGNDPQDQEDNKQDHKNLIFPVVPMVIGTLDVI